MPASNSEFVFVDIDMPASDTLNAMVYAIKNSSEFEITKIDIDARLLYCKAVKTSLSWGNRFALKVDDVTKGSTRITVIVRPQDNVNRAAQNLFLGRIVELTDKEFKKYGYRTSAMRASHTRESSE